MTTNDIYIVDLFETIVANTATGLNTDVFYQYGNPLEIVENLQRISNATGFQDKKYPLIALFQDFDEGKGKRLDVCSEVNLHIIIATLTDQTLLAKDRYIASFKPILYPVYDEFLIQIKKSGFFIVSDERLIPHTKTDRLYWGRNGLFGQNNNLFNDYIDCIEITNLNLKIKSFNCKKL